MVITLEQAQVLHSMYVQRKYFYEQISDKYIIKFQLGKVTKEEWEAKRQEVKDMFPYPDGVNKEEALQIIKNEGGF
tara:strand:+ start:249 stop:476 length:228 start_codon:yes stop_codon:yes gene_type:complete